MEPTTRIDHFILDQASPHLGDGEHVHSWGYLVEDTPMGIGAAKKARAWFVVVTNLNLIRIQTRVGALKPIAENHAVLIDPLEDIAAAYVSAAEVVVRFTDGRTVDLRRHPADRHVSSQRAFLEQLKEGRGHGDDAEALALEQTAFDRSLREMTPRLVVTPTLISINVIVFLLMALDGASLISPSVDTLISWGADFGPLTTGGEYWRLLTCTFVHIGVIHLAFNMWVLWSLGQLVERMVGHVAFASLYFVTGLLASIASVFFNPLLVSAGASGAVFGVAGGLATMVLVDRGLIPAKRLARLRSSIGLFILYNLVYGFTLPNIDQAAHLGGLASGMVFGLFLVGAAGHRETRGFSADHRVRRGLLLALVGMVAIAGTAWALPTDVADVQQALDDFVLVEKRVIDRLRDAEERQLSDADLATVIDRDVLPEWSAARERLAAFETLPKDYQERIDLIVEYASTREQGWRLLLEAIRTNDLGLADQAAAKQKQAEALIAQVSG